MAQFKKLEWNNKYKTDVKRFDIQHEGMFLKINKIINDYEENVEDNTFLSHVKYLIVYANNHLMDEEEAMMSQYFQNFTEHKKEHDEFRNAAQEYIRQFEIGKFEKERFIEFLIDWWEKHIRIVDMKYKNQIKLD